MEAFPEYHPAPWAAAKAEIHRLGRRLERERRARFEAETLAEHGMRALYERQRALQLLQAVAAAANTAKEVEEALQIALREVCEYTGWPLGRACFVSPENARQLAPASLWHASEEALLPGFREAPA